MIKDSMKKYVFVYNNKDINTFNFNNQLNNIFGKYLEEANLQVLAKSIDGEMPLCIWNSQSFTVIYFSSRLEINVTSDLEDVDELVENNLIDLLQEQKFELKRIGMVTRCLIEENDLFSFLNKKNIDYNKFKNDFEISWLDKLVNGEVNYNCWIHTRKDGSNYELVTDINNIALESKLNSPKEIFEYLKSKNMEIYNGIII